MPTKDKIIHNFKLIGGDEYIEEINTKTYTFRHIKTGARVFAMKNKNPYKTFLITFKTPPLSDKGIPHILEHIIFNGSKKYPINSSLVAEMSKNSVVVIGNNGIINKNKELFKNINVY